jgi:hypothetical protein
MKHNSKYAIMNYAFKTYFIVHVCKLQNAYHKIEKRDGWENYIVIGSVFEEYPGGPSNVSCSTKYWSTCPFCGIGLK